MATATLTVDQLVDLAASTCSEGIPNAFVLQSILHILVEKLNLGQEMVELVGPGVETLENLTKSQKKSIEVKAFSIDPSNETKRSPVVERQSPGTNIFTVKGEIWDSKNEKASNCEEIDVNCRINALENFLKASNDRMSQLQCDLREVRRMQDEIYRLRNHKLFQEIVDGCNQCRCDEGKPKIPFCVDYSDPFNEVVLGLLSNKDFLVELMKRISCPILDKVSNWENQLQILGELFQKFIVRAEDEYEREPTAETNAEAIRRLQKNFVQFRKDFLQTIEEIQEMLDAKLDKYHIPPLKKFINDELTAIHEELTLLRNNDTCPDAVGTTKPIFDNLTCISCAGTVCQRTKPLKTSVFRKAVESRILKPREKRVSHPFPKRSCGGTYTVTAPKERVFRQKNLADEFGVKVVQTQIRYLEGVDGNMYRVEPEIPTCTCNKPKETEDICPCPEEFPESVEDKEQISDEKEETNPTPEI